MVRTHWPTALGWAGDCAMATKGHASMADSNRSPRIETLGRASCGQFVRLAMCSRAMCHLTQWDVCLRTPHLESRIVTEPPFTLSVVCMTPTLRPQLPPAERTGARPTRGWPDRTHPAHFELAGAAIAPAADDHGPEPAISRFSGKAYPTRLLHPQTLAASLGVGRDGRTTP